MNNIEQENQNMKDPIEAYQSQFDPRLPTLLKRTTCGVAGLYSALKYLDQEVGEYPDFASKYITTNSLNIPFYKATVKMNGHNIDVPLAYVTDQNGVNDEYAKHLATQYTNGEPIYIQKEESKENEIIQTFSVDKGFDHRGITPFLAKNNIPFKAEIFENNQLPTSLEKDSVILASVDIKKLGYPIHAQLPTEHISTHIIAIYQISEIGDTKVALFSDPAFSTPGEGLQVRSIETLKDCTQKYTTLSPTDR